MPYCTECGAEISETDHFCADCGTPVDADTEQGEEDAPPVDNAEQLVDDAMDDSVTEKWLTGDTGWLDLGLETKPIIEHLKEDEQPHFLFSGQSTGFELAGERTGQIEPGTPHQAFLLITDQRLLGLIGQNDGDEVLEIDYEDIEGVEVNQHLGKFTLTTETSETSYTFHAMDDDSADTDAALNYIRSNAGLETVDEVAGDTSGIDRRRALKWGGAGFVGLIALSVAFEGAVDDSEETLVDISHWERRSDTFEAEEGDTIQIYIENDLGFRTHVAIESPEGMFNGEVIFSEGIQDEAVYEMTLEHSGEYIVRMDPDDGSTSSGGSVQVVLLEDEN